MEKNEEYQKEIVKITLYAERLKIYCNWIQLIENANSSSSFRKSYSHEEKISLYSGTRFLFSEKIAEELNYYLLNYEEACIILDRSNLESEKDKEMFKKFHNAVTHINSLLSSYLIVEVK